MLLKIMYNFLEKSTDEYNRLLKKFYKNRRRLNARIKRNGKDKINLEPMPTVEGLRRQVINLESM